MAFVCGSVVNPNPLAFLLMCIGTAQHSPYRMLRDVPELHRENALGWWVYLKEKRLDEAVFAAYG